MILILLGGLIYGIIIFVVAWLVPLFPLTGFPTIDIRSDKTKAQLPVTLTYFISLMIASCSLNSSGPIASG